MGNYLINHDTISSPKTQYEFKFTEVIFEGHHCHMKYAFTLH
jgi:hypothetical protein